MEYATAFRDSANRYCMIYLPVGKKISLDLSFMNAKQIRVWWFEPLKGEAGKVNTLKREAAMSFTSPSLGIENDWVLVIEDANAKFPKPGK